MQGLLYCVSCFLSTFFFKSYWSIFLYILFLSSPFGVAVMKIVLSYTHFWYQVSFFVLFIFSLSSLFHCRVLCNGVVPFCLIFCHPLKCGQTAVYGSFPKFLVMARILSDRSSRCFALISHGKSWL